MMILASASVTILAPRINLPQIMPQVKRFINLFHRRTELKKMPEKGIHGGRVWCKKKPGPRRKPGEGLIVEGTGE